MCAKSYKTKGGLNCHTTLKHSSKITADIEINKQHIESLLSNAKEMLQNTAYYPESLKHPIINYKLEVTDFLLNVTKAFYKKLKKMVMVKNFIPDSMQMLLCMLKIIFLD